MTGRGDGLRVCLMGFSRNRFSGRPNADGVPRGRSLRRLRVGLAGLLAVILLAVIPMRGGQAQEPTVIPQPASNVLTGVFGDDNRVPVASDTWPFTAIGRVNRQTGGHCTGVLIAPRYVLTAAHCLYHAGTGAALPAGSIHFVAGFSRDAFLDHSIGRRIIWADGTASDYRESHEALTADVAVLELAEPMSIPPVPVLAIDAAQLQQLLDDDAVMSRVGYSQDRPYMLGMHEDCAYVGPLAEGGLFIHSCDATHGDSGSPLLLDRDGEIALVAVHAAVITADSGQYGAAVSLAPLRDFLGAFVSTQP